MKNLPEDDLFDALGNRLRGYEEQPDEDVWKAISNRSRRISPPWMKWADGLALLVGLWVLGYVGASTIGHDFTDKERLSISQPHLQSQGTDKKDVPPIVFDEERIQSSSSPVVGSHSASSPAETSPVNRTGKIQKPARQSKTARNSTDTGVASLTRVQPSEDLPRIYPHDFDYSEKNSDGKNQSGVTQDSSTMDAGDGSLSHAVDSVTHSPDADVLLPERTISPEGESLVKTTKRFSLPSLYVIVSPTLTFQHVSPNAGDQVVIQRLHSPSLFSSERRSIAIEVGLQGALWKRFDYVAGVSFFHQSSEISYDQLARNGTTLKPSDGGGYLIEPGRQTRSVSYNLNNAGVQAGVLYTLDASRLTHQFGVMLQYEVGFRKFGTEDSNDREVQSFLNYRIVYRAGYDLNSRTSIFMQPFFSRSLIADRPADAPFSVRQSRVGVGLGLSFRF